MTVGRQPAGIGQNLGKKEILPFKKVVREARGGKRDVEY